MFVSAISSPFREYLMCSSTLLVSMLYLNLKLEWYVNFEFAKIFQWTILNLVLKAVKLCKSVTGEKAKAPNNLHFAHWMFCNLLQLFAPRHFFADGHVSWQVGWRFPGRHTRLTLLTILDLPKYILCKNSVSEKKSALVFWDCLCQWLWRWTIGVVGKREAAKKGGVGGSISAFTAPPWVQHWVSRIWTEEDLTYLATGRPPPTNVFSTWNQHAITTILQSICSHDELSESTGVLIIWDIKENSAVSTMRFLYIYSDQNDLKRVLCKKRTGTSLKWHNGTSRCC